MKVLGVAVRFEDQVLGLDVAMKHADFVRSREPRRELARDA